MPLSMREPFTKGATMRGNCWRWIGLVGSGWIMIATMGLVSGLGEPPSASAPLPQAPEGVRVLAVAAFEAKEQEPVRIAAHPVTGRLYVLGGRGDVTLLDVQSCTKQRVISGREHIAE